MLRYRYAPRLWLNIGSTSFGGSRAVVTGTISMRVTGTMADRPGSVLKNLLARSGDLGACPSSRRPWPPPGFVRFCQPLSLFQLPACGSSVTSRHGDLCRQFASNPCGDLGVFQSSWARRSLISGGFVIFPALNAPYKRRLRLISRQTGPCKGFSRLSVQISAISHQ